MDTQQQQAAGATQSEPPAEDPTSATYVAVIENRAKEVGLAALDLGSLTLQLSQYIEPGRHYANTHLALRLHHPRRLILVGSTTHEVAQSGINKALTGPTSPYESVKLSRSCFDDTQGAAAVHQAASSTTNSSGSATAGGSSSLTKSFYLAYGAAGALLQYVSTELGCVLRPHILQVSDLTAGSTTTTSCVNTTTTTSSGTSSNSWMFVPGLAAHENASSVLVSCTATC
jgi:DNA mismatch repair protein MSH4